MSRSRKSRPSSRQPRPFRSVTSQMSPTDHAAVDACQAAELRGDWATALAHYRTVPFFRDATHGERLELMAALGDDAPSWLRARWLTVLARRLPTREQRGQRLSIEAGLRIGYPHGVPMNALGCTYPEQVPSRLWGLDWLVRQLDVYELGALDELLDEHAGPELVSRAGPLAQWRQAPMGGYRVGGVDGDVLTLYVAGRDDPVEVLDLGLLDQVPPGSHVLGRVVPVAEEPGAVLEWRPLVVDEPTAVAVARKPAGWLAILETRLAAGRLPEATTFQSETSLVADLPHQCWTALVGRDMDRELDEHPRTLVGQALRVALRLATDGPEAVRPRRHAVAALLLDRHLTDDHLARFATSAHLEAWRRLAQVLPVHARRRCDEMVLWCDAAGELTG